jgi:predicted metalloprotease
MRDRFPRWLLALVAVAILLTGCGALNDDGDRDRVRADEDDETPTTAGREFDDVEERFEGDGIGDDDEVILAALQDVENYWDAQFEDVFDEEFEPVSAYFAYGPDTESPPCGSPPPPYEEIAGNAFFCPGSDLIAWDTTELIPDLQEEFGDFTLGIVMAHEYGHALQDRIRFDIDSTIGFEQQADCFAGAWAQWVEAGEAQNFDLELDDLDKSLAGFLNLRDSPNTSLLDPAAHGTGFDRVSAFQDGFFNGADRCAEYSDEDIPAVPLEFFDEEFFLNEPDAPLRTGEDPGILDFLPPALEEFWTGAFDSLGEEFEPPEVVAVDSSDDDIPDCDGDEIDADDLEGRAIYCAEDNFVAWDEQNLLPVLHDAIGDMAVGLVVATQYSEAALAQLDDDAEGINRTLRADCMTGAFIASSVLQEITVRLSPGDLDESVVTFLTNGDPTDEFDETEVDPGTAFVRFAALRRGFVESFEAQSSLEGVEACLEFRD